MLVRKLGTDLVLVCTPPFAAVGVTEVGPVAAVTPLALTPNEFVLVFPVGGLAIMVLVDTNDVTDVALLPAVI